MYLFIIHLVAAVLQVTIKCETSQNNCKGASFLSVKAVKSIFAQRCVSAKTCETLSLFTVNIVLVTQDLILQLVSSTISIFDSSLK